MIKGTVVEDGRIDGLVVPGWLPAFTDGLFWGT